MGGDGVGTLSATEKSATPAQSVERGTLVVAERYEIERPLGAGGMGVVHAARDLQLGRAVAIKMVRERIDSEAEQERLLREARAMASLRHPNIVTVHDIGASEDRLFVVMELIEGGTVADWLSAEARSWRQIVDVYLQAARGLGAAHAAGFVHLDFKPANVLIGTDGVARVSDFGVARILGDAEPASAATGGAVGTPGYIAPEILRHEPVDARADQFSFCVALYSALHGERPFAAREGPDRLTETLGPLRSPRAGAAPRWLERAIARGLSPSPSDRWPSMDALAAAIARRLARPRRLLVVSAIAVAALAVAATAVLSQRAAPERPKRMSDVKEQQLTFDGQAFSRGLSPDGKTLAYGAHHRLHLVDIAQRREREIAADRPAGSRLYGTPRWLPDSSAIELLFKGNNEFSGLRIPREDGPSVPIPPPFPGAYAPDGNELAVAQADWKEIRVQRGAKLDRVLPVSGTYDWLCVHDWSPDGEWLVIGTTAGNTETVWSLSGDGRRQIRLFERQAHGSDRPQVHLAPSGRGVLYLLPRSSREDDLMFLPLRDGAAAGESRAVIEGIAADDFSISRDAHRLAYTRSRGPTHLWRIAVDGPESPRPETRARRLLGDAVPKSVVRIAPDGKRIVYVAPEGRWYSLFIVGTDGGQPRRLLSMEGDIRAAAWSPDGSELAFIYASPAGKSSVWIVSAMDGRARQLSMEVRSPIDEVSWAPGSTILVAPSDHRNLLLVDPRTGAERPLLKDDSRGFVFGPEWSPDGGWVALWRNRSSETGLWVVSADGQRERYLMPGGGGFPVGWSPDSQWIYRESGVDNEPVRVSVASGEVQPWLKLSLDEDADGCSVSADNRQMACLSGAEHDVWMIEDLDRLLPR